MFQRILIAALVVIVAGMAATAYFSFSAARQTSRELMAFASQSSQQFGELTTALASLKQPETPAALPPPELRIYCSSGSPPQPLAGYSVRVGSIDEDSGKGRTGSTTSIGQLFYGYYKTDESGWIETGPLPPALYSLNGQVVPLSAEGEDTSLGEWTRVVPLQQDGLKEELRVNVNPGHTHEVTLELPPEITWDRDALSVVGLHFSRKLGPRIQMRDTDTWLSRTRRVNPFKPNALKGLWAGQARVELALFNFPKDEPGNMRRTSSETIPLGTVEIPDGDGPIRIVVGRPLGKGFSGIIYDGSKDNPVVGAKLTMHYGLRSSRSSHNPPVYGPSQSPWGRAVEPLVTDARGRFGSISNPSAFRLQWKAADGKPAVLWRGRLDQIGPPGELYEIDVSKLGTVRLKVAEDDSVADENMYIAEPPSVSWQLRSLGSDEDPFVDGARPNSHREVLDFPDRPTLDLLLFPGKYEILMLTRAKRVGDRSSRDYKAQGSLGTPEVAAGELVEYHSTIEWHQPPKPPPGKRTPSPQLRFITTQPADAATQPSAADE